MRLGKLQREALCGWELGDSDKMARGRGLMIEHGIMRTGPNIDSAMTNLPTQSAKTVLDSVTGGGAVVQEQKVVLGTTIPVTWNCDQCA